MSSLSSYVFDPSILYPLIQITPAKEILAKFQQQQAEKHKENIQEIFTVIEYFLSRDGLTYMPYLTNKETWYESFIVGLLKENGYGTTEDCTRFPKRTLIFLCEIYDEEGARRASRTLALLPHGEKSPKHSA